MSLLDGIGATQQILINGIEVVRRGVLNFTGSVTVTDDPANKRTTINVTGGGGGGPSTSDAVSNLSSVAGSTVTSALNALLSAFGSYVTTSVFSAHTHAHGDQAGGTLHAVATAIANGFMSSADKSKLDSLSVGGGGPSDPSAAPPELGDSAGATGTVGTYATATHTHAHGNRGGGSLHAVATTSVAGFLSASDKSKLDGIASGATNTAAPPAAPSASPPELADSAGAQGTNGTYATATHTHAHGNRGGGSLHAVVTTSVAGFMSSADKVKLDGIAAGATVGPAAPSAAPPELADSAGAQGTNGTYATATHTHAHGNRGGGSLHAVATTTVAGFLSAADKTKLDGIATGATAGPAVPTVAPQDLSDATAAIGTTGKYAAEGHVHAHGNRGGGTLHAVATTSVAGFLSAADKVKLDTVSASTYRLPLPSYTGVTASPAPAIPNQYTLSGTPAMTVADLGRAATDASGNLYIFTAYQVEIGAP